MENTEKQSFFQKLITLFKNIIFLNSRIAQLDDVNLRLSVAETRLGSHLVGKKYWLEPGVGLNAQLKRKSIFETIVCGLPFKGIVESGTNLGFSTGYMAAFSNLPVYSCEIDPMRNSVAGKLLSPYFDQVHLVCSNSVDYLKKLAATEGDAFFLFYLDAHWYKYLPLREEIDIICNQWKDAVIMIDDFKVEGDEGYGYDSYGSVGILELNHISTLINKHKLDVFFPAFKSSEETGAKRGYVILSKGYPRDVLSKLPSLVEYK